MNKSKKKKKSSDQIEKLKNNTIYPTIMQSKMMNASSFFH
jgi:hypothetical protein